MASEMRTRTVDYLWHEECISQVSDKDERVAKQDSTGSVKIGTSRNCWRKGATGC